MVWAKGPLPYSKACHLPQHLWEAQILYIHFFDLQMKGWIDLKLGKERTVYCVLVLDPKKFKAQYCILWWGYGEKIALSVYRFIHFSLTRRELCRGRRRTHKTQTIMRKKATLPSVEEETLSKTDELIWRRKGRWYLSFNLSWNRIWDWDTGWRWGCSVSCIGIAYSSLALEAISEVG